MSKLKAYPRYKNSGVEWIGEVPEGWKAVKSSLLFFAKKGASAAQLTKEYCAEHCGEFPVYSGQTENNGIMGNIDTFEFDSHDSAYILSTTVGAKAMSVSYLHGKFSLSQNCMIIGQINSRFPMKFFFYLFDVLFAYERRSIPDHMQPSFRMEDFYSYKILLPPLPEQQAIAAYLDRETAQIDALITRKTRSIELLREKRQAMITHAVTKGLDPNAKMKDSDVEWIGEVPEGWKIQKLGLECSKIGSGKTPTGGGKIYQDTGVLFLRSQNIYDDGLYLDDIVYISTEIDEGMRGTRVRPGDILLNITGGSIGRSCIVPDDFQNANVNQHVCIIRLRNAKYRHFVSLYMKSYLAKWYVDFLQTGAGREGLNFEQIGNFKMPLPPLPEQQAIASYLDAKCASIDTLISKIERSIDLLREKRQALITAAVTGKIDVREAAPEVA